MGLKEYLLKRITINRICINDPVRTMGNTILTADNGANTDKNAIQNLLDMALFRVQRQPNGSAPMASMEAPTW